MDAASLRDLVTQRAELGESRESDRIKSTIEWLRQQREVAAAEREAAVAEHVVRRLAVTALPEPLVLSAPEYAAAGIQEIEALKARLLEANPRLRAARGEVLRQQALASAARRGRIPDLNLAFVRQNEIDKRAGSLSIGLVVPLWNANRGEIARAEAAARVAEAEAARTTLELANELDLRFKEVEIAAAQVALLDGRILPAATQSMELARLSYREGETSLLDLLDAQRTLRETQREASEARLALRAGAEELRRLLGPAFPLWRTQP